MRLRPLARHLPGIRDSMQALVAFVVMLASTPAFAGITIQGEIPELPPVGCYFYGYKFSPPMDNITQPFENVKTPMECQAICKATDGCHLFGHFNESKQCFLGSNSHVVEEDLSAVGGPRDCPAVPAACTAYLPAEFPGNTKGDTINVATTGIAAPALQCWPRTARGELAPCDAEPTSVLEDFKDGWPAQCQDLAQVASGESCEVNCRQRLSCASWVQVDADGGPQCWQGLGYKCYDKSNEANPIGGQRFLRGHVRVLKDLEGIQVMGPTSVFPVTEIEDQALAVEACKRLCYSSVMCSTWLYSSMYGCYVEDPARGTVEWPPTTSTFDASTDMAKTVVAGEYIQHLCGDLGQVPPGPHPAAAGSGGVNATDPQSRSSSSSTTSTTSTTTMTSTGPPATLAPGADARVSFVIENLVFANLGAKAEQLSTTYAFLIAKALGVGADGTSVWSLAGVAGHVTLGSSTVARRLSGAAATSTNTHCECVVDMAPGSQLDRIASTLGNEVFTQEIVEVTDQIISADPAARAGPLAMGDVAVRSWYVIPSLVGSQSATQASSSSSTSTSSGRVQTSSSSGGSMGASSSGGINVAMVGVAGPVPAPPATPAPAPEHTSRGGEADKEISSLQHHWRRVIWVVAAIAAGVLLVCLKVCCCCWCCGRGGSKKKKRSAALSTGRTSGSDEDDEELLERDQYRGLPTDDVASSRGAEDYNTSVPLFGVPNLRADTLDNVRTMPTVGVLPTQTFASAGSMHMGTLMQPVGLQQARMYPMQQSWR